jgi:hypothetical protein
LPEWAALAVLNLILDRHHLPGWRGAGNTPKRLAQKDYVDFRRWLILGYVLRENQMPREPSRKAGKPRMQEAEMIQNYRDVYKEASERLSGKVGKGTPQQIKASFDRVETAKAAGKWMPWY